MAKYENRIKGDFDELLGKLNAGIVRDNVSNHYEDGSDYLDENMRCAVRVYERYSMLGKSRVSLAITLFGKDDDLFISIITSGGNQTVFSKINTWGESSFLQRAIDIIENYKYTG